MCMLARRYVLKPESEVLLWLLQFSQGFPAGSEGKVSAYNAGGLDSIPGTGTFPREGNGSPLQYTCLENPMDGEAW